MKMSRIGKKIVALGLVASMVAPLVSDLSYLSLERVNAAEGNIDSYVEITADNIAEIVGIDTSKTIVMSGEGQTDVISAVSEAIKKQGFTANAESTSKKQYADISDLKYTFHTTAQSNTYNFTDTFTYDGKSYTGLYRSNIKKTENNINLELKDIGTVDDPYVILEITPSAAKSEMRPHVGGQGLFELSAQDEDNVKLTPYEENAVKLQVIYAYDAAQVQKVKDRLGWTNPWYISPEVQAQIDKETIGFESAVRGLGGEDKVAELKAALDVLEKKLYEKKMTTKEEFDLQLNTMLKMAREYKIQYLNAPQFLSMQQSNHFTMDVDYVRQYKVENGKFVYYNEGDTASYKNSYNENKTHTAVAGEMVLTEKQIVNPMGLHQDSMYPINYNETSMLVHNYTFRKSCLDLGFEDYYVTNAAGEYEYNALGEAKQWQRGRYDEYVFTGWQYVNAEGEMVDVTASTNLADVAELYTSWVARRYETETFEPVLYTPAESVKMEVGDAVDAWTVCLPPCIVSAGNGSGYSDPSNQLSFCVPVSTKHLISNDNLNTFSSIDVNYAMEYSARDFIFRKSDYGTYEELLQIAPKLMPDTDYMVMTYADVADADTMTVDYYPYNVQVITVTPDELNKLVYKDYSVAGAAVNSYLPLANCKNVSDFFNNIDFIYFAAGQSVYFYNDKGKASKGKEYNIVTGEETKLYASPNIYRAPQLYTSKTTSEGLVLTYVDTSNSYAVEKVYDVVSMGSTDQLDLKVERHIDITNENKDTYGTTKVDLSTIASAEYLKSGKFADVEWQIVEKIYNRIALPVIRTKDDEIKEEVEAKYKNIAHQGRRIAMIFNQAMEGSMAGMCRSTGYLIEEQADGTWKASGNGEGSNFYKLVHLVFESVDPTFIYDCYFRNRAELKLIADNEDYFEDIYDASYETLYDCNFQHFTGVVRGSSGVGGVVDNTEKNTLYGTHYTGSLYGFEQWNVGLLFPFEMVYDLDEKMSHQGVFMKYRDGSKNVNFDNYGAGWSGSMIAPYYQKLGFATNNTFFNIANPFAYTFNGGNDIGSSFFDYYRTEISNPTNGFENQPSGNTYLAFDYFREVKPSEIHINGSGQEVISTKSAIEFMVQNAQRGIVSNAGRKITILNSDYETKFITDDKVIMVDTVVVDDFSKDVWDILYTFKSPSPEAYYTVEYLWTPTYQKVDNDNRFGAYYYYKYTTQRNEKLKWYSMPGSSKSATFKDGNNVDQFIDDAFRTFLYVNAPQVDGAGNPVLDENGKQVVNVVKTEEVTKIIPKVEYAVESLIKPNVLDSETRANYIIAIKQYPSETSYRINPKQDPVTVTLKNVTLGKMSHLFDLD